MAQTDTQTDGHGDSMTNSAQWGRVGEKNLLSILISSGDDTVVVILATVVALLDVIFIIIVVPESLPTDQKLRPKTLTFKQVVKLGQLVDAHVVLSLRWIHSPLYAESSLTER